MKILLIDNCHEILENGLIEAGHQLVAVNNLSPEQIIEAHNDAEGMVVRARIGFPSPFLQLFPKLRFIARFGSGMEHIDVDWAEGNGIACLSAPEGNRDAVGEHALGMLLTLFNRINTADAEVRSGQWIREGNRGIELTGKTVGIIGYGHMGSSFAQKIRGFDVRILVFDKYRGNFGHDWIEEVDLDYLISASDIISIHLTLNDETKNFIDSSFLNRLSKSVFLINTSRGNQLVLADLLTALKDGTVKGACLDVLEIESSSFENAQIQKDNEVIAELLKREDIVFTPHIAGWTQESKMRMAEVLLQKILKVCG